MLRLTEDLGKLSCQFLSGESDEIGTRDHGNIVQGEDPDMVFWAGITNGDSSWNEGPQDIDGHRKLAG